MLENEASLFADLRLCVKQFNAETYKQANFCGVYAIYFDRNARESHCLYVGASENVAERLRCGLLKHTQHSNEMLKTFINGIHPNSMFKLYAITVKCNKSELKEMERMLVNKIKPIFNTRFHKDYSHI